MKLVNDQALDANGVKHLWKRIVELVNGKTPTKVSELENDSGYLSTGVTSFNGSTGNVVVTIPTKTSQLQNDSGFITSDESAGYTKSETDALLNGKQNTLVSSVNIKTINNESILGAGDITIQGGGASAFIAEYGVTTYADVKDAYDEDATIICTVDDSGNTVVLQLSYYDDANDTFCFTQPVNEGAYWASISIGDIWDDGYFQFASTDTATQLRDGLMSALDWQKLDGIESGAEVNVQSDWNQTTTTAKDYIKNKPTIPDVTGKADKVSSATNGHLAGLNASGNLTDSGYKSDDFLQESDHATFFGTSEGSTGGEYSINNYTDLVTIVDKNGRGTYTTIQSAVNGTNNGDTILIMPGVYEEDVHMWGKERHLVGLCKDTCIITNGTGNYLTPPLEANIGSVENLTIIADNYSPTVPDPSQNENNAAYGIHIEYANSTAYTFRISNCKIISKWCAGVGIGLRFNQTIIIENSELISEAVRIWSVWSSQWVEMGGLFFHNDATSGSYAGTGKLIMRNTVLKGKKAALVLESVSSGKGKVDAEFLNNTLVSEDYGVGQNVIYRWPNTVTPDGYLCGTMITLAISSHGNNNNELNS